ncbi:MAG: FkbM family methyltransferase [Planctomycetia bacterium]|nr:FkbM family methyltransferase [Planctomycetia bacterium]
MPTMSSPRRLILRLFQSPGDTVMMTAAVRDLHLANRGKFETDVRTSADAIWLHNPYITRLSEGQPGVEYIEMHYPLIQESNQRPFHFIHGFPQYLEQQLGVKIPVTRFAGDIHLSAEEKNSPPPGAELGIDGPFWIVMAGGKYDFTAKWWNPASYQKVVDHFRGKIQFVQCGEAGHWHPPLEGVINLVGKTDTRGFIRLIYHADGVVCPVTFAMHLAAAVETKPGRPRNRPCVVISGGREPPHWEAYPHHQFLSTVGALPCCADGGCWKSRCQLVGDGDMKDRHDVCVDHVQVKSDLRIPRCMDLITPEQVIERIELYYRGGALTFHANGHGTNSEFGVRNSESKADASVAVPNPTVRTPHSPVSPNSAPDSTMNVLITFRHGLGDASQLSIILKHLQKYRPNWRVDVAALVGKHSVFHGMCRKVYILEKESPPCCEYQQRFNVEWHECQTAYADSPSTKAERCLREEFGIAPDPELCTYTQQVRDETRALARAYLEKICAGKSDLQNPKSESRFPVVLIHYEGNTSTEYKNIPSPVIARLCEDIIEDGYVPVILDWDYRNAIADGVRIHCPDQRHELWHGTGTGDAESIAALIELSSLLVGVDSGPLHIAGATSTPTLAVWTRHHPIHYFSLSENVLHLVPHDHAELIRGDRATGETYFARHYRSQTYRDLEDALRVAVRSHLRQVKTEGELIFARDYWIRANNGEQDLVVVQDIAERDSYHIDEIPMPRPVVVDVGAHIGCFAKRLHQRNPLARIFAIECCPENIPVLQKNVGDFATVIQAAVTYETDVALLNAIYPNCGTTGGSELISRGELEKRIAAGCQAQNNGQAKAAAHRPGPQNGTPTETAHDSRTDQLLLVEDKWADFRPLRTLTLEELMQEHGLAHIDILKLDCEKSEFSILGKSPSLDRIGLIVGEYHGKEQFEKLIVERFSSWDLKILRDGELGTFWLTNPAVGAHRTPLAPPVPVGKPTPPPRVDSDSDEPLTLSLNGTTTFGEALRTLREAAPRHNRLLVEHYGDSQLTREACDTFTAEHPEFERRLDSRTGGTRLLFEKRPAP